MSHACLCDGIRTPIGRYGGAIALGHPLGMSGTRRALTAWLSIAKNDLGRAICTMCIGVGQGIALLLEKP